MLARLTLLLCFASAPIGCARNSTAPVATVLGQPIYAADVTPTEQELSAIRDPETTPGERLREEQRARITSRIIRPLEDRYVRERGLRPAPEEVDAFVDGTRRRNERIEQKLREDLAAQRRRLTDTALTQQQRDDAALRVEAIESLLALKNDDDDEADEDGGPAALAEYEALSQRELASVWVGTWKFHRALHREFGGPVVSRNTGPEPVGAYRKWLESLERRGDFTIADPDLRELFWTYWRRDADVVMDPDVDPFATPWWLDDDESADLPVNVQSRR